MISSPLRVILADDEPLARERLRRLLRAEKGFELAAEARDGPEAVSFIRQHRPHVALLDIRLPGLTGFEVLAELGEHSPPAIIFVTAFAEQAVRAFDVHGVDYLLKPFTAERFREALKRARLRCACAPSAVLSKLADGRSRDSIDKRIALRSGHRKVLLSLDDILYAKAANTSCEVFTAISSWKVTESLGSLETRLPADRFLRISRFIIVNIAHVASLQAKSHGDQHLVLRNQTRLTVARTRRADVLACLQRGI